MCNLPHSCPCWRHRSSYHLPGDGCPLPPTIFSLSSSKEWWLITGIAMVYSGICTVTSLHFLFDSSRDSITLIAIGMLIPNLFYVTINKKGIFSVRNGIFDLITWFSDSIFLKQQRYCIFWHSVLILLPFII